MSKQTVHSNSLSAIDTSSTEIDKCILPSAGLTYRDLRALNLPPRREIVRGIAKGEIGLLNAINNAGKTTLFRNLSIAMATGRAFQPFVPSGKPMRVAYVAVYNRK